MFAADSLTHQFPAWFLMSQLCVSAMASLVFWAFYTFPIPQASVRTLQGQVPQGRDKGFLFLALATVVWALWPAATYLLSPSIELRIYFSILNSAFFLLAAAFFEYGPRRLKFFQVEERWVWLVICGALVTASVTSNIENPYWRQVPDVVLSSATLLVLGWAVCMSLYHRAFKLLALVASAVLMYMYYAQILEILPLLQDLPPNRAQNEPYLTVLLTSKILFIVVLFLVSLSWLHQRWSEQIQEDHLERLPSNRITIELTGRRSEENRRRWIVTIKRTSSNNKESIVETMREMTSKPHLLLAQFALRKEEDPNRDGGMMNIADDSFYHADLNKIHKLLQLEIPTLFKNHRRDGAYLLRDGIDIVLRREALAQDPDMLALMKKESQLPAAKYNTI